MSGAGLRAGLVVLALHVDLALLGQLPGALRAGQRRQVRARVEAHRQPGGPRVGQALERGLAGQRELIDRLGLLQLAAGRVVPLARVGERLLRRGIVAVQVHHLAAESFVPALGVGPRVVQASLLAPGRATPPDHDQSDHQKDDYQQQKHPHVSTLPSPIPSYPSGTVQDVTFSTLAVVIICLGVGAALGWFAARMRSATDIARLEATLQAGRDGEAPAGAVDARADL